jgi:hypothetical protein
MQFFYGQFILWCRWGVFWSVHVEIWSRVMKRRETEQNRVIHSYLFLMLYMCIYRVGKTCSKKRQSYLNYITNKLYLMSCCQWLGFRERHGSSSFMGIAWSIRLTGNNLVFNDIKRNMKSCFSLTLHWLSAWLQNYCEEHFNRCIHQVDWFSFFPL